MEDFYKTLSFKVAGLFNWLYQHCPKMDFILKVDDDVYVNVRTLLHFIQLSPYDYHSNKSVSGIPGLFAPSRGGKWTIPKEEWPWNQYPPYILGPAVLVPGSTIIPLLAAFQTTPMMPFNDVYYTEIRTEKAGIKPRFSSSGSIILSMQWGKPLHVPGACGLRKYLAWLTKMGNK